MFVRKKKNKSGSTSVQIISKSGGAYKVVKSLGSSKDEKEIAILCNKGIGEIKRCTKQKELFLNEHDAFIEGFAKELKNCQIKTVGPEIILGKLYDRIGYNQIKDELFRH